MLNKLKISKKMKKIFIILFMVICFNNFKAYSQFEQLSQLIQSGVTDAEKLSGAYLKPITTGFIFGMGNGWYNTAKTHKLGGFDIGFGVGYVTAPASAKNFNIKDLKLNAIQLTDSSKTMAPTIFGNTENNLTIRIKQQLSFSVENITSIVNEATSEYQLTGPQKDILNQILTSQTASTLTTKTFQIDQEITSFDLKGLKGYVGDMPLPEEYLGVPEVTLLQAAVGLPLDFEVGVRYVPTLSFSGWNFNQIGFQVKHEFKRWIPGFKTVPIDVSALLGYNHMAFYTDNLDYNSMLPINSASFIRDNSFTLFNDQKFSTTINSFTTQIIISKKLLIFTPYIGFGFTSGSFNMGFKGHYAIPGVALDKNALKTSALNNTPINELVKPALVDPNSTEYVFLVKPENKKDPITIKDNATAMNATVGFRLQLLLLSLNLQYTIQPYAMYHFGMGFSFR